MDLEAKVLMKTADLEGAHSKETPATTTTFNSSSKKCWLVNTLDVRSPPLP